MRTRVLLKVAALAGLLALTGCAAKVAQPNQYSGFLKDYSSLKETFCTFASGEMRKARQALKGTSKLLIRRIFSHSGVRSVTGE